MRSWIKDLTLLTVLIGVLIGATVGRYPVAAPDGARYAEIPREMVVTGDYLTPHLNGVKYFEKPPLFYWMQAASIKMFGVNEIAVSLINALMILATALCIYITSRKLFGRLQGLTASFIFTTMSLVFALSRIISLDVTLTFFITGSLSSFLIANQLQAGNKRTLSFWLMYIFAACAVMTKGLVGIGFLGLIIAAWITIFNEWRSLKTYHLASGTIIFLLIVLPWHILVQFKNPEFFKFYFIDQHFLRYFTDYAHRTQKWWFLPVVSLVSLYPWLLFFPQAINHALLKALKEFKNSKSIIFLLLWIVVIYVIYTFSKSKLIPYILPIFPPIAMLIGNYFVNFWQEHKKSRGLDIGFYSLFVLNIILGVATIVATFTLDFNEQAFSKQNLYIVAAIIIASAFITLIIYRHKGLAPSFISIIIVTSILYLYISPVITTINRQSIKPLITTMQQKLKPEDEVMTYGNYYQDLPFYTERIVTVANFLGELEFGTKHQDTSGWIIDQEEFWKRWMSDRTIYLITRDDFYPKLKTIAKERIRIIAKLWDTLLLTNSE